MGGKDEDVERGEDAGHVLAEAEEEDEVVDPQVPGLPVELELERALADDDDLHLRGAGLDEPGGLDEIPVALVVLERGDDPDQEIVRGEAEFRPEEIPVRHRVEGRKVDPRGDDVDDGRGDAALEQDVLHAVGDGDDAVDVLRVLGPGEDVRLEGKIHPAGDDPDRDVRPAAGHPADRDGVGVVEMGQDAPLPLHVQGEAEGGADAELALHRQRQDGQPFGGGLLVERASRLDDEVEGIPLRPELAGEVEGLPLAAAPLLARVNLKEAQCAPLSSRSRAASRSGGRWRIRSGRR